MILFDITLAKGSPKSVGGIYLLYNALFWFFVLLLLNRPAGHLLLTIFLSSKYNLSSTSRVPKSPGDNAIIIHSKCLPM